MRIDDDHMYHGAALIQIAEDERFTAINSLRVNGTVSRSAYRINDDIVVYLKYATKANRNKEYGFTFTNHHIIDIDIINSQHRKCFIALVCVGAREICLLDHGQLKEMIEARRAASNDPEESVAILVTAPDRKKLQVYVNSPNKRGKYLKPLRKINRSDFPSKIFE